MCQAPQSTGARLRMCCILAASAGVWPPCLFVPTGWRIVSEGAAWFVQPGIQTAMHTTLSYSICKNWHLTAHATGQRVWKNYICTYEGGKRKMWNLSYAKGTMKALKIKAPISIQVKNNCVWERMNFSKINRNKGNKRNSAVELRKSDDSWIHWEWEFQFLNSQNQNWKKALKVPEPQWGKRAKFTASISDL